MKSFKLSLIIITLLTNFVDMFAQDSEKAYLLVKYKSVIVNDTSNRAKPENDITALEISKNGSRFYSVYFDDRAKELAEWKRINGDKMMDMQAKMKAMEKRGNPLRIYKNKYYWTNGLLLKIGIRIFTFKNCTKSRNRESVINLCLINDCPCLNIEITSKVRPSL